jgi:hypothetical protein
MNISIPLQHVKDELGVSILKDANDLLYFCHNSDQPATSRHGSIYGYTKIQVYEKIITCSTVSGLFEVYIREKSGWLSYEPVHGREIFDFYEEKPIAITDDYLCLSVEGSRRDEYAFYIFKTGTFVPDNKNKNKIGLFSFSTPPIFTTIENQKAIIFHRDKRMIVFILDTGEFLSICAPEEYKKEVKETEFHFICDKYAVFKFGYDFTPKFHIYSFEKKEYVNILKKHDSGLDEKYWRPFNILCTEEHVALCYKAMTKNESVYWEILSVENWKNTQRIFNLLPTTTYLFDSVRIEEGKLIAGLSITRELES